tara:strand:+ start:24982 stop:25440 length:459 start_codon:yes stop_codon:yes gene_type:complete
VILGYLAMAVVVMGGLTAAYLAMGADGAFEAGSYQVTSTWIVVWLVTSVIAAVAGGFVCVKVGKSKGAVVSLLVLVGVFGAVNTAMQMNKEIPAEDMIRAGDTPNFEAMTKARAPTWMYITEPMIGVFGAMIGATLGCGCRSKDGDGAAESA